MTQERSIAWMVTLAGFDECARDRRAVLARLLSDTEAGIRLHEHITEDGPTVFAHACRLGVEGIVSKKVDGTYRSGPCRVWIKVRNPTGVSVQRERGANWNREPVQHANQLEHPPASAPSEVL